MRPMVLLASALFPSLILAGIQAGCSSDDSTNAVYTPPDSGPVVVPEAGPSAQSVAITIVGKGIVVSTDGVPDDGGPNGFVGGDGGAPVVDCPGVCTAPQGVTVYAYPQVGTFYPDGGVKEVDYVFVGWTAADGGVTVSTNASLQIGAYTSNPLTATFVPTPTGATLDGSVAVGEGGSTMPFQEAGPGPSDDSGSEDGSAEDTGTATDSGSPATDGGDAG